MNEHAQVALNASKAYTSGRKDDWNNYPGVVTSSLNLTPPSTTGETPFFLVFGRDPYLPSSDKLYISPHRFEAERFFIALEPA